MNALPMKLSDYPPTWKEFSKRIRFERAKGVCECSGACGIEYGAKERCKARNGGYRVFTDNGEQFLVDDKAGLDKVMSSMVFLKKASKIVLTVAHLCKCRPKCADEKHVLALCQSCHLKLDIEIHKANRAKTLYNKKYKDQPSLFKELNAESKKP